MPNSTSPAPFLKVLRASGLVAPQDLQQALGKLPANVAQAELADYLVDQGWLNPWQVEQLCQGRTKFTLGQYAIVDTIARGGMGYVFKGRHQLLDRVEAVKVLPRTKSNSQTVASFRREIRAQASLQHPNIVRVSYADADGDTLFLVTEFVPGTDLRRLVRRSGVLSVPSAAWIISQAALGLEHAHRSGVVHRDVKPGNLLVSQTGEVKLADLGLAYFLSDQAAVQIPQGKQIAGTSDYLAPESIANPSRILPISDIYSLGCTLYYAVTGKVPYPGGSAVDKLRRCLDEPPLAAQSLRPELPGEFVEVIEQMMHKEVEQRLPTAQAVVESLSRWLSPNAQHLDAQHQVAQQVQASEQAKQAGHWSPGVEAEDGELDETLNQSATGGLTLDVLGPESTPSLPTNPANSSRKLRPLDLGVWLVTTVALLASLALLAASR